MNEGSINIILLDLGILEDVSSTLKPMAGYSQGKSVGNFGISLDYSSSSLMKSNLSFRAH